MIEFTILISSNRSLFCGSHVWIFISSNTKWCTLISDSEETWLADLTPNPPLRTSLSIQRCWVMKTKCYVHRSNQEKDAVIPLQASPPAIKWLFRGNKLRIEGYPIGMNICMTWFKEWNQNETPMKNRSLRTLIPCNIITL